MEFDVEWNGSEWEVWAEDLEHDIFFCPEGADEDEPPTDAQHALIGWFVAHAEAVIDAALEAVLAGRTAELEIVAIHIQPVVSGDRPYVGIELEDPDDGEHGAGVLMHGTRVVRVGGADVALLQWMAEEDAEAAGR